MRRRFRSVFQLVNRHIEILSVTPSFDWCQCCTTVWSLPVNSRDVGRELWYEMVGAPLASKASRKFSRFLMISWWAWLLEVGNTTNFISIPSFQYHVVWESVSTVSSTETSTGKLCMHSSIKMVYWFSVQQSLTRFSWKPKISVISLIWWLIQFSNLWHVSAGNQDKCDLTDLVVNSKLL